MAIAHGLEMDIRFGTLKPNSQQVVLSVSKAHRLTLATKASSVARSLKSNVDLG